MSRRKAADIVRDALRDHVSKRSMLARRLEAGLSQAQLAELAGVDRRTVAAYERRDPTLTAGSAAKIEAALKRAERRQTL